MPRDSCSPLQTAEEGLCRRHLPLGRPPAALAPVASTTCPAGRPPTTGPRSLRARPAVGRAVVQLLAEPDSASPECASVQTGFWIRKGSRDIPQMWTHLPRPDRRGPSWLLLPPRAEASG